MDKEKGQEQVISLENQTQTFNDATYKIVKWEVWFQTPFGLTENLALAVQRCKENDMPIELTIRPMPVAITENGDYEVILK